MLYVLLAGGHKKVAAGFEWGNNPIDVSPRERHWHIGEKNPIAHEEVSDVLEVQADGDELAYICRYFRNIPLVDNCSVVRWFGDDAKFIAAHLKEYVQKQDLTGPPHGRD